MTVDPTVLVCPICGGTLEIVLDGLVTAPYAPKTQYVSGRLIELEWRREPRRFVACTACEFCKTF